MAYYILLPDGRNVEFPDNFPRDQAQAIAARMAGETQAQQPTETAPAQPQRGSNLGVLGDVIGSGISGLGGIATAGGGLYGLATGDYDTGATRFGRRVQEYGETFMSPQLLEARERLDREMREAEGQGLLTEAGVAARGVLTDPRLLGSFVAEQVPQFIGSLGVGRIAGGIGQLAARRGGAEAAEAAGRRAAVGAAIGTGTGLQTGEVANSTYEDIINLPAELIERSPNYQTLRQTMTDEEARHQLGVEGSRVAAAIAAPISAGTAALFGAERFALGEQIKRRAISRVVLGATGEATQEGIEEGGGRFAQNVGALRGDIERDLSTGVGGAAARGAILGGIIGGGTGLISGRAPDLTARGEDTELSRALDPYLASIERTPAAATQPGVADRVRLVTENLPFTAEQFLRATPEAQDRLVARAEREAERRQSGQNLSVLDPQGNRDRETANIRAPQSASRPSDELIYGQAGSRADAFQFERGRGERMEGGMTQAEFLRQRAEEMARAQAGTGGVSGQVQAEGARQLPANVLKRSDRNLTRMLATASPEDARLITRELERRRAAGAPATGTAATEATLAAAGQTYRPSLGTGAEQTAAAARATRPTEQPVSAFFPLVENFIEGHVRNYGSSQPLSVPAFQQYLSERTGDTVSLKRAGEIFDTYYNASSKRAVPKGQGWVLQRSTVKQAATKGEPSGRGRGRMPPKVAFGPGAQSQRIYRAVAPKGVRTDADGRPLPPAAPPAAPLRASPSGFTDPRQRELSAREVGAQPAEAAQTEFAQDAETTQRATKIVNDRLDKIEKKGGKKARAAVEKVIRDGKYNAEQVYAAFMAADRISSLLPVGANHEIEFVERLLVKDAEAAKASGALNVTEAQGERVRPTGDFNKARFNQLMREGATADQAFGIVQREAVNGIIRLSLAPNQLAVIGETASHEAFHVLQDYYAKYDPNFSKLMGQSFKDGMVIGDVDPTIRRKLEQAKFPGSDQSYWQVLSSTLPGKLSAREAQAYVFGSLADAAKRGVPMSGLKPAFARFVNFVRQFFTRMGNALRGQGFQTAESMLGRVARGDAQRFAGRATPTDVDFPKEAKKEVEDGVAASPTEYSARDFKPMEPPAKTVTAYKLFRVNSRRPNEIFPLFVDADMSVPMGEWIEATDAYHFTADNGLPYTPARTGSRIKIPNDDIRRELFERGRISRPDAEFVTAVAYRPGWHASDLPYTTHLTEKNRVWAEVEMAADVDWQERANANAQRLKSGEIDPATAQITDQVPLGGFYRYKTNPNMTGEWMISGGMKVNRVLDSQEVQEINSRAEQAPEYSARQINTPEFKRWFGDSKVVDAEGKPLVLYRGLRGEAFLQGVDTMEPREGYATFLSTSPYVASTYANPDMDFQFPDDAGAVFPVYVKADSLVEFPVRTDAQGYTRLDFFEFDKRARNLQPGEALVARGVVDIGPRSSRQADPEGRYSYPSDIYAIGKGTQTKSATGNRGTFDPADARIDYSARDTGALPEELTSAANQQIAPERSLKRALQSFDAGILSEEVTARLARKTSPEGLQYEKELEEKRNLWLKADSAKAYLKISEERLREPNLTEAGIFKIQKRISSDREKLNDAIKKANAAGVDVDGPFPSDERLNTPVGLFPGDERYFYKSYAPEGYPFDGPGHDFADERYRVPTSEAAPKKGGEVKPEFSARDLSGLGTRVRNATPSDIRSKQFDVEYTRVSNLIDRGLRKVPFVGKRVKDTTAEDLIILMQDRMLPLGRMVDFVRKNGGTVADASDIYMTEELYHGRVGAGVDDRAERLYKPVFDEMRRLNISMKDMDDYLEARHAPERNAFVKSINEDPSKGAGITDDQADAIMKRLAPQKAKLEKVAKLVDAIVADTNKTRAESGLTPDYSKLNSRTNFKHYVPLRGFAEEDIFDDRGVESLRARTGQGFKMRGQEDRSITGRRSRATNILANVILQNEETVIRSEKNKVGQALLKLIRDNPQQTAGFAKILEKAPVEPRIVNGKVKLMSSGLYKNRDDVMVVKEGGNEVAVEIYDERLAKALTGASGLGAENSSMVLRGLAGLNRFLAMVNTTLNPEFVISNFARDLQTANINIKQFDTKGLGRKIISDVPMALAGARAAIRGGDMSGKWAQAYEDFRRAGGTTEFLGLRDIDGKLEKINEEIMGNKGSLIKRPFKAMLKLFEDYNSVAENAIRLSTFQTLRDMGVSDAKAAQVAKNLTVNFNKAGQNRVLMNSLYLFYNASIQGSMAMINAIARSKRVRKYVAGIITAGFMHDVINAMMSGMDEDERKIYDKIPDYVLERNYVLMDPFGMSERGYYALPMPYGFNAFFNMGRNLSRVSRGEGDPMKTAGSIVMGFVDAFNPIGGTQSFYNFVAPTILDPFFDMARNRNFADRPIVPEQSGFGPQSPDSQRFWSNTFPPYVTVAQWLNQITGGTSVIPGQVDISPNTIGYLMNFATGAAGAFAERVAKFGFSTVPDMLTGDLEEVEIRDIPFVRKLYGNVTTRNDLESFMENTNRIAQIQKEFDEAERFGEGERMERAMRDYPRELAVAPLIQGLVRERQKITREMNEIRRDPNIDAESRRELLRVLKQEADMYVGQVNMLYNTQVRR